jgi:hypothetical protein
VGSTEEEGFVCVHQGAISVDPLSAVLENVLVAKEHGVREEQEQGALEEQVSGGELPAGDTVLERCQAGAVLAL